MTMSIRTKFTLGIVFFFAIIAALLIFSTIELNMLSKKTGTILKENYFSVIYAREMSEALININQEITHAFLINEFPDSASVNKILNVFDKSLQLEKKNITEVGEDKLVSSIESGYIEYCHSIVTLMKMPESADEIILLQRKFIDLNQQILVLSQMNGKAIEIRTDDAKISAKKALVQMSFFGTLCFLITMSFTYSFASYFNGRFFQLHNGIKEIVSSNYGQRLYFDGKDEFYEIALVFNEMAEKLSENVQNRPVTVIEDSEKVILLNDLHELKSMLARLKDIEEQGNELIAKFNTPVD
jgi:methyl-accepting chemotaxis protein